MYSEINKYKDLEKLDKLQVVNIGTGYGFYDFNYEELRINAFNFALPTQTLEFDYKILCHYSDKLDKKCKVLIVLPLCIFAANTLYFSNPQYERYYDILPEDMVSEVCNVTLEEYKKKSELNRDNGKLILELVKGLRDEELDNGVKKSFNEWVSSLGIFSFLSGDMSAKVEENIKNNTIILIKILNLCKEKEWEPIIIIPPMSKIMHDKVSSAFRKTHQYDPIMKAVSGKAVQIIDYTSMEEDEFGLSCMYGTAVGFLVKKAAKLFTYDVMRRIDALPADRGYKKERRADVTFLAEYISELQKKSNMLESWMIMQEQGKSFAGWFKDNNFNKISIYGYGTYGKRFYNDLKRHGCKVKYIIDRQIVNIDGEIQTILPVDVGGADMDVIIVTAVEYFTSIKCELEQKTKAKIISLAEVIMDIYWQDK